MKKNEVKKIVDKKVYYYLIIASFLILCGGMTVGFALYNKLLSTNGLITVTAPGQLEIIDITRISGTGINSDIIDYKARHGDIEVTVNPQSQEKKVTYKVEATNNGNYDYIYSDLLVTSNLIGNGNIRYNVSGFSNGDVVDPGETINLIVEITFENLNTSEVDLDIDFATTTLNDGSLVAAVTPNVGDIRGDNERAYFELNVLNTYEYKREFTVSLSNNNLKMVDGNGQELNTYYIDANSSDTFGFYIVAKEDAIFLEDTTSTEVMIHSSNISNFSAGNIVLDVDIYVEPDTEPPVVGNARLTVSNTEYQLDADWQLKDEGSSVVGYGLKLYDSKNALVKDITLNTNANHYTFTNVDEGSYYFVVYGIDEVGNTGASYVSSATANDGYAVKSSTVTAKWFYKITYNVTNLSYTGSDKVRMNGTYTTVFTPTNGKYMPTSATIKMGTKTLGSSDYSFTYDTGELVIPNVTGDITITASASNRSCLVEGTKIMLADGTQKNIEDITYDDLLLVFNYETGTFIEEYPIWIEKEGISEDYMISKFSDGTILKTTGYHGIFSVDANRFIDVLDKENYKVGTRVLKYDNNKLKEVTVTDIKIINKPAKYYQVVSSIYYNVISNNIITTDGNIGLVNMYGFDSNMLWQTNRNEIKKDASNLFTYEELMDVLPHNMYLGLRANEMKYLIKLGYIKIEEVLGIKEGLKTINNDLLLKGYNNIKVSLSTGESHKITNNHLFKLPTNVDNKNLIGWLNTVDNKIYKPGDVVKIDLSTHFKAIYEDH